MSGADIDENATPPRRDRNNPASRESQNKPQLLEATMRNVPKLKELNYTQWKNVITNSIKKAKLWGYVDGSIEEPSDHDSNNLATYYDEAAAVRNAILGSLESAAQRYIEEALDPRDAWVTLEKKYLSAEADVDVKLVSIEKQLADLRLEEGGDIVEHIAEFCRMRSQLNGTRLALDESARISMLYRSLPPSLRQSAVTSEGTEMRDFNVLCGRLNYLSQNPEPEAPADNAPSTPVEDHTSWGVPADIKAFGVTGDKNPLLEERAAVTCRDCLLKDHEAGTPECPQYEWRRELWGDDAQRLTNTETDAQPTSKPNKMFAYEFSEPIKVILNFQELKLKEHLVKNLSRGDLKFPHGIQQCAILPAINGRNVITQAPPETGRTTAIILSIAHLTDAGGNGVQAIILSPTEQKAMDIQSMINSLGYQSYTSTSSQSMEKDLIQLTKGHRCPILVGTPDRILQLFRRGILHTPEIKILALDDLDTLVDTGFQPQILDIYRCLPRPHAVQTLATSSEFPLETLKDLEAGTYIYRPLYITAGRHNEVLDHEGVTHAFVPISGNDSFNQKRNMIMQLIWRGAFRVKTAILCDTVAEAESVRYRWTNEGYRHYYANESMNAEQNNQTIQDFRVKSDVTMPLVITTSIQLKRRLDAWEVDYFRLINFSAPSSSQNYIERIGYLSLSSSKNMVITLVNEGTEEIDMLREIGRHLGIQMVELHWNGNSLT